MAAEEIQVPVVEEQVANPAPVNPTIETEVPPASKEKKTTKPRKPRAPATHPPYIKMIQEAITSLKEKTGSSQYAITKFIEEKHKDHIPPNFKKLLLFHLRKLTAGGKLIKVKNSYKIPSAAAKITKTKETYKPKPKISETKPKAKSLVKRKSMAVVKPNTKPPFSAKHETKLADTKPTRKSVGKLKPVAKVAKPKPKTVTARPAKAAKTSEKYAPGKKKKIAPAVKKAPAAKALERGKRVKPPAKKTK